MAFPKRFLNELDKTKLLKEIAKKLDLDQGLANAKKLLYVDDSGKVSILALGDGLEIQNGEETVLVISNEGIESAVEKYLTENPVESGMNFKPGNALEMSNGVLNVKTTDDAEEDNTLPITSAGVNTIVGNIGAILDTI